MAYAGVKANGALIDADVGERQHLLELDRKRRHDSRSHGSAKGNNREAQTRCRIDRLLETRKGMSQE